MKNQISEDDRYNLREFLDSSSYKPVLKILAIVKEDMGNKVLSSREEDVARAKYKYDGFCEGMQKINEQFSQLRKEEKE